MKISKAKKVLASTHQTPLHQNLDFTAKEQYRLLRTNLMFTLPEDEQCPVIGVSSSIRGEGKSTTSINLSYFLAEKESRVLLIDGDLRIPSIAQKLDIRNSVGLTDMLIGMPIDILHFKSDIHKNLYVLPSGEIPPNPSELLGSERMKKLLEVFKEHFDYIIVDLPPVTLVSDAVSASRFLTGILVVIRENYVSKKEVEQCMRQLKLSNANILGCVMTDCDSKSGSKKYRQDYGTYGDNRA